MGQKPQTIRLADYRAPDYAVTSIELDFDLEPHATVVVARTRFRRLTDQPVPLHLDGENLVTERLAIDGRELTTADYAVVDGGIVLHAPPAQFQLEVRTRLDPAANTTLSGLYLSSDRFCTQCEAEGFRRITYALDRPDVMTRYTVRLAANATEFPTLLSNGNPVDGGPLPNGRHFAIWHDPHPKPTYLFALAAGRYESLYDTFTTQSGQVVTLGVHVDPGEVSRAHYALDSLRRAMVWDERVYQREYDLRVFHLVAVRDFNFGAMENKGLNIFNASYVLADPESATDGDFEGIEAVVGHEYFHNWTGNRITCRDWFQLSLKEGLTVFREQEFCADQRSRAVQRIKDVLRLRARQFPEDQGPLAHPVRPASYQAIDNFYTATVYEKGAEVIRMLQQTIGEAAFARGMQLYFARRDGTASTVEDFVGCLAEAGGHDLSPFLRWYDQAGTPVLQVRGEHDAARQTFTLRLHQHTPPTPGQAEKSPLPLPLRIGLLAGDGTQLPLRRAGAHEAPLEHRVVFDTETLTLQFEGISAPPVPAVLRGFCAPVRLDDGLSLAQRFVQMAHDPDPFTRWEAGQQLARNAMLEAVAAPTGTGPAIAPLAAALGAELDRAGSDPAFAALALHLPELPELVQHAATPDPDRQFHARERCRAGIATALRDRLVALVDTPPPAQYSLAAAAAGARALRSAALELLAALGPAVDDLLWRAYTTATNMTDSTAALDALGGSGSPRFDAALADFHARWRARPLVLDKWFALQAGAPRPDALARVQALYRHPSFELRNPNRVRALVKTFATRNLCAFHAADGSGYRFVAEVTALVDAQNPALAAKLLQPFESWRRFDATRQAAAATALRELGAAPALSKNLREMLDRTLA